MELIENLVMQHMGDDEPDYTTAIENAGRS